MKSFLSWMEGEETPSLAEPQHKKGEANMGLDKIVEKRVRSMIMDLESSGKGTQEEILKSILKYTGKMGVKEKTQEQQPSQVQEPQGQPQMPQPQAQPMPQGMAV